MTVALAFSLFFALGDVDAAYGRLDGDVALAGSAGIAAGPRDPRAVGDLRLRYLQTVGLFGTFEAGPTSVLAFGAEVRPLFIARWAKGWELDSPRLDLLIDSFALELGTAFVHPERGSRDEGMRHALQAGVGLEFPLFQDASGPFLGVHGGARWSDNALAGNAVGGPNDRALFLALSVGWQQIVRGHIVDLGDADEGRRR